MASTLPDNPSIDRLRSDARRLQRGVDANDPDVLETVRQHHPRPDLALTSAPSRFALHDAQLTVARSYGFTGWPTLVHYLQIAADLSVDPSNIDENTLDPADRFCTWSSLRYDDTDAPPRWQAAAQLLDADPNLVDQHGWAAACAADANALSRHLASQPGFATTRGGLSAGCRSSTCAIHGFPWNGAKTGCSRQPPCCSKPVQTRMRGTCGAGCRRRSPR